MVREIVTDPEFLTKKSSNFFAGRDDHIIQELIDTAEAHEASCVGLAAPQIGYLVRAIVVKINGKFVPFTNPTYSCLGAKKYPVKEGCMSVEGTHCVKRSPIIMLSYDGPNGKRLYKKFYDMTAQIIQHEVDHLKGILISTKER